MSESKKSNEVPLEDTLDTYLYVPPQQPDPALDTPQMLATEAELKTIGITEFALNRLKAGAERIIGIEYAPRPRNSENPHLDYKVSQRVLAYINKAVENMQDF